MMISTKSFVIKTLALVLVVFTIFTVSLTEELQLADGFSVSAKQILFELNPGETGEHKWTITNSADEPIFVELYATGPGSELMVFDNYITIEPHKSVQPELFVIVPKDHPNNIEYHPELFALNRGAPPPTDGGILEATVSINIQMKSLPIIKIGPNPIYTAPIEEKVNEIPPPPKVKAPEVKVEEKKELTAAEKIAAIQEANKERTVDDTFEESFEEEAVTEYEPEPEYQMEPRDTVQPIDTAEIEKIDCDFVAWFLSIFGIGKC